MTLGTQSQVHGKLLDYEQFIDQQLARTRTRIKLTDIFTAGLTLGVGFLAVLFVEVVLDHLFGLPLSLRQVVLVAGLTTALLFILLRLVFPLVSRINAIYAAKTIEEADASFKNSLINYLDLRRHRDELSRAVMSTLEARAVIDLTQVEVDNVVNQHRLMRMAYAFSAVVVVFCLYAALTPKSSLDSARRAFLADVLRPTNTQLRNIKPGNCEVVAGENISFTVNVEGVRPTKVLLHYSVDGGKFFAVRDFAPGHHMYDPWQVALTGVQQSMDYFLTGGDAESLPYHVGVLPAPMVTSITLDLDFPPYTKVERRTNVEGGNIEAIVGTAVTVHAVTNMPAKTATLNVPFEGNPSQPNPIPMEITGEDQSALTGHFTVKESGSYTVSFRTPGGQLNPNPVLYDINAIPDRPPTARFIRPEQPEIKVPANVKVDLVMTGSDDHAVKDATLHVAQGNEQLVSKNMLEGLPPQPEFKAKETLDLARFGAKPGSKFTYWMTVRDNKEPISNHVPTEKRLIEVVAPVSPEEKKKIEETRKKESELLDQASQKAQNQQPSEDTASQTPGAKGEESGDDSKDKGAGNDTSPTKERDAGQAAPDKGANTKEQTNGPGQSDSPQGAPPPLTPEQEKKLERVMKDHGLLKPDANKGNASDAQSKSATPPADKQEASGREGSQNPAKSDAEKSSAGPTQPPQSKEPTTPGAPGSQAPQGPADATNQVERATPKGSQPPARPQETASKDEKRTSEQPGRTPPPASPDQPTQSPENESARASQGPKGPPSSQPGATQEGTDSSRQQEPGANEKSAQDATPRNGRMQGPTGGRDGQTQNQEGPNAAQNRGQNTSAAGSRQEPDAERSGAPSTKNDQGTTASKKSQTRDMPRSEAGKGAAADRSGELPPGDKNIRPGDESGARGSKTRESTRPAEGPAQKAGASTEKLKPDSTTSSPLTREGAEGEKARESSSPAGKQATGAKAREVPAGKTEDEPKNKTGESATPAEREAKKTDAARNAPSGPGETKDTKGATPAGPSSPASDERAKSERGAETRSEPKDAAGREGPRADGTASDTARDKPLGKSAPREPAAPDRALDRGPERRPDDRGQLPRAPQTGDTKELQSDNPPSSSSAERNRAEADKERGRSSRKVEPEDAAKAERSVQDENAPRTDRTTTSPDQKGETSSRSNQRPSPNSKRDEQRPPEPAPDRETRESRNPTPKTDSAQSEKKNLQEQASSPSQGDHLGPHGSPQPHDSASPQESGSKAESAHEAGSERGRAGAKKAPGAHDSKESGGKEGKPHAGEGSEKGESSEGGSHGSKTGQGASQSKGGDQKSASSKPGTKEGKQSSSQRSETSPASSSDAAKPGQESGSPKEGSEAGQSQKNSGESSSSHPGEGGAKGTQSPTLGAHGGRSTVGGGGGGGPAPPPGETKDETKESPRAPEPTDHSADNLAPAGAPQSDLVLRKIPDLLKNPAALKDAENATGLDRSRLEQLGTQYQKQAAAAPAGPPREITTKPGDQSKAKPSPNLPKLDPTMKFSTKSVRGAGTLPLDPSRDSLEGMRFEPPAEWRGKWQGYKDRIAKVASPKRAARPSAKSQ